MKKKDLILITLLLIFIITCKNVYSHENPFTIPSDEEREIIYIDMLVDENISGLEISLNITEPIIALREF